ncbi:signal peptidase I [Methanococcoides sp. FTZ1]|uniref:signal peptidase I n=1 Tax=Methanococcoides sp. FTZ1 TaxID=3439061 RepID=UPI003F840518
MNVINTISTMLVIIVTMPMIFTMVPMGPVHFMTVTGFSMEPTITASDIIVVTATNSQDLAVGDIISYRHQVDTQKYIVTHRIVSVANGGYRTKGDACAEADSYIVAPGDVVGTVRFKIPFLGTLVHFAATTRGLVTLVIMPAIIVIILEIRNSIR